MDANSNLISGKTDFQTECSKPSAENSGLKDNLPDANPPKPKYILLEKTKAVYTLVHPLLMQFPSNARFTLGEKLEKTIIDAIEYLIMQNYKTSDEERKKMIFEFIAKINIFSVLLQQAVIFRYISFEKGEQVNALTKEIQAIATARYSRLGGNHEDF